MGKANYRLEIDLKPALDEKKLDARILRDFEKYSKVAYNLVYNRYLFKFSARISAAKTEKMQFCSCILWMAYV